jgi:tRNA A37 methylthiotransferase MiaB
MKKVDGKTVKERTKTITDLHHKISEENNKKWIGWKGKILIDEEGKPGSYIGRNQSYKQIIVQSEKNLLGKELEVEVKDATAFDLRAEIISFVHTP